MNAKDPSKKEHILVHVPTHHAINCSCMHMMGAKECEIGRRIRKFRKNVQNPFGGGSPLFSLRNGTMKISLPLGEFPSFQSLISRNQLRENKLLIASAISFGWFADFGKTLTIQRSSQPVYFDKW